MFYRLGIISVFLFLSLTHFSNAQEPQVPDLPRSIRGYKVHKEVVSITNSSGTFSTKSEPSGAIDVNDPKIVDISLSGVTIAIFPEIEPIDQSGRIDILAFHDFKVNGVSVDVEEFTNTFSFKKGRTIKLPDAIRIKISPRRLVQSAFKELTDPKDEWQVSGRVFVFGAFRKFGFSFKRVVPVDIKLTIPNPLYK